MTNFDMYEITLDVLRKDRKGAITIEEFEKRLKFWSLWMFKQLLPLDGATSRNEEALVPFKIEAESQAAVASIVTPTNAMAHFISGSVGGYPLDLVTSQEYRERENNEITKASTESPLALIVLASDLLKIKLYPADLVTSTTLIDYYKYPTEPYMDYYVDVNLNYQYLTEGQTVYTLGSGEVARNESTTTVTSQTAEVEWRDAEKVVLIEYILSDLGVGLKDEVVIQKAMSDIGSSTIK